MKCVPRHGSGKNKKCKWDNVFFEAPTLSASTPESDCRRGLFLEAAAESAQSIWKANDADSICAVQDEIAALAGGRSMGRCPRRWNLKTLLIWWSQLEHFRFRVWLVGDHLRIYDY